MHSIRLSHYIYRGSLFFLILLTAAAVALSAADVIIQALADPTEESDTHNYRNLIVVVVSYVVLAIFALSFSCSRILTVRVALQDIPKSYIPITQQDLPKKVYDCIQQDFDRVKQVRENIAPRLEDFNHIGWGQPGVSNLEGVNFKRAIIRTPFIIEQVITNVHGSALYARFKKYSLRQYIESLIHLGLVDEQLGRGYIAGYEQARFSREPINEERYFDIMKYLAAILRHMGYRLQGSETERPSSRGDQSYSRDDDVVSLAHSIGTLASRSTSISHRLRSAARIDEVQEENHLQQFVIGKMMIDGVRPPF
ncbi:hypothetical protein K492DRAFT_210517 [Lichtheimia hyalospora FSU 10163]|nr:hypothetical protein K492DRAFT_210517 [Lichtheimia hyalospora FSU 10163]